MIKKILFATDLGAFTAHAQIHVESLADQYDAEICIVHAVTPLPEFAAAVVKSHCSESVKKEILQIPHIEGLLDSVRDEIYDVFVDKKLYKPEIASRITSVVVTPGNPASVILLEAEKQNADLIVIGSHGTDAIDGRILGSVASKVLQLTKVPVFMIPMMHPSESSEFAQSCISFRSAL